MSLGWLSIGSTGDIALTGLNVDSGTLIVDKANNRVGINTNSPYSGFQVNGPVDNVNNNNALVDNTVSIFANSNTIPGNPITGTTNLNGTLWINSKGDYVSNTGASIAIGGRTFDSGTGERHSTLTRISGVNNPITTGNLDGEMTIETLSNGTLYERMRIKTDGKVGIGTAVPSGGLDVRSDVISVGASNSGYRRDVPQSYLTPGSSNFRVSNDVYASQVITPASTNSWLGRIDGTSTDFKEVWGLAMNPTNGDVYAVGVFTGNVKFYNSGSSNPTGVTLTADSPGSSSANAAFLVKYNQAGAFNWAARLDTPSYQDYGMSVTVVNNEVIVTGCFENGTFVPYNQGTSGSAFTTTIPSDGSGLTGFIVKYNAAGNVQSLAKIDSSNGYIIPTCIRNYSNNGFYIGGHYSGSNIFTYDSTLTQGPGVAGGLGNSNTFLCYYNSSLVPQWITIQDSNGSDITHYPGNCLSVDQEIGDVYMTGIYNGDVNIRDASTATIYETLSYNGSQATFLAKWNSSGIVQWAARLYSSGGTYRPSVAFSKDDLNTKYVYLTGSFLGTVEFRNSGNAGALTTTQQASTSASNLTNTIVYLTQYNAVTGANNWSTKIQSPGTDNAVGIAGDSFGNAYVAFNSQITSVTTNVSTFLYQRNSFTAGGVSQASSNLYKHVLSSSLGSFGGVAIYNIYGKIMSTAKVDGADHDYLTCIHVNERSSGTDRYPRIFIGGYTEGYFMNLIDGVSNVVYNLSNLPNSGNYSSPSTSSTSFIAQVTNARLCHLDYTNNIGTTKKIINTGGGKLFVVPYVDASNNIELAFTNPPIEVPTQSSLELILLDSTWSVLSNSPSYLLNVNGNIGIGTNLPRTLFQVDGTVSLNGNVGIGTINPVYNLHINSFSPNNSYSSYINQLNSSSGGLLILCSTNSASQKAFTVKTSSTPQVTAIDVLGDGTVNIGGPVNVTAGLTANTLNVTGAVSIESLVPPGTIVMWSGNTAPGSGNTSPAGWLICDGSEKSQTTYSALYSVIGNTFGAASTGSFKLPNLQNRFPFGKGSLVKNSAVPGETNLGSYGQIGSTGGDQVHTLTESQMARHHHYCVLDRDGNAATYNNKDYSMARVTPYSLLGDEYKYAIDNQQGPVNSGNGDAEGKFAANYSATNKVGNDQPHNNMPPYFVINFIIKT